jgi:predicted RNA methylase
MNRLIFKFAIIVLSAFLISYLSVQSPLLGFLAETIFLLFVVLLLIILSALVTEFGIFRKPAPAEQGAKGVAGAVRYSKIRYKNIDVSFLWRLNGGGIIMAHEFVRIVSRKMGKVGHVFEYCAGPGFIGFDLLANGLCDKLTLAEVNPEAVEAIKDTIRNNNLQDRVTVYLSDGLEAIPETEQWDLVVGNPPWCLDPHGHEDIMVVDAGGHVHERFFKNVNKFLKPDGSILFIEGAEYTRVNDFRKMVADHGLRIAGSFKPISFLDNFKGTEEYPGLRINLVILLRLGLLFREVYFIWVKRNDR